MSIFNDIADLFKSQGALQDDVNNMLKADGDKLPEVPETPVAESDSIGRKAIIDDPYFDYANNNFIFKSKQSRIAHKTLKDVSLRDWLISSIIQNRADTLLRFSRPQHKPQKLEMGYKVIKRDGNWDLTDAEKEEIEMIEDFIYHCGRKKHVAKADEMLFSAFLKMTVRDALTFGHVAIEKVMTRGGALHRFRPVPSEATYRVSAQTSKKIIQSEIENARASYKVKRNDANDPKTKQRMHEQNIDYYKYVQMSHDNKVLAAFGDEDMIFKLFNPQNFQDSMGYCYSPLELAVINITNHLNVENYNSNFFTHGYAARGILHLKGNVTQSALASFRRQFYNQINGAQHAWRTPIISGLEDIDWVSLAGSNKEMEYLQYNDHVMRALCTQFQIDPMELGLEYLSRGGGGGSQAGQSGEEKIQSSKERGLLPILMFFEDLVNADIIPAIDKSLAKKYKFIFTGYTNESPQTNVSLLQAEMTVHSSMNDLLKDSYKTPMKEILAADLPLNQSFWALVEKHMTKGEIRETFFGDKGASLRPELQYFPADAGFMPWQQMLMSLEQVKQQAQQAEQQAQAQQAEAQAQKEQQDHDNALAQASNEREQQAHDAEMQETDARHREAVKQATIKEIAKESGVGSKPIYIDGKPVKNPINQEDPE